MTTRAWTDPVLFSNGLFVGNAVLYAIAGAAMPTLAMLLCAGASITYHYSHEWEVVRPFDVYAAYMTLGLTVGYAAASEVHPIVWAVALLCLGAGLIAKKKGELDADAYGRWHTIWHVFVALGQAALALGLKVLQ